MRNASILLLLCALIASCSTNFSIEGTSDVSMLDGHMLFLKGMKGNEIGNLDSCDIVHGKFSFHGQIDSTQVGAIFLDNENLMPVVLEEGDIKMTINSSGQKCSGSPLNDKLSEFTEKFNQIVNQMGDLQHQHDQAIMDGKDLDEVVVKLQAKADKLAADQETLITKFIEENFDNVLAPFAFQLVTENMQYPMLSPWIEALMSKATDTFKNNDYVREFMQAAERNQNIMNGMEEPAPQVPTVPADQSAGQVPTPNELAAPAQ